ncbi:MAG: heavy metal-binding domain-containing protein [Chitinophagales bacterium]
MKTNFKLLSSFLTIVCLAFMLTSCGGNGEQSHEGHNHGTEASKDAHKGHNHDSHKGHDHSSHEGHDHGSHEGHNHGGADAVNMTTPAYASAYVCPMHCKGSGSAKAGTCPVCKMEYVANAEHKEDGHKH